MNRLLADDPQHVPLIAEEADALRDEHLGIPSTDRRDVDEAVIVDVLHDHTDLIDVAVEHDRRVPAGVDLRHAVPGDVDRDFLGERLRLGAPDARRDCFEARGGGSVEQTLEEAERGRTDHGSVVG